ncbi:hypothetical protein RI129_007555 [Pyrocoelia pectoralis]|uniref:Periodic tryptophan protein 1 n=1 Tax=Pyrocoelia pectoralis TaxID=417401 RepID=A0AAN7V887_9COLE
MEEEPKPGRINFISCVKWVKKGVAKGVPEKVRLNKQELVRLINQTKADLQAAETGEGDDAVTTRMNTDDEFNLENYDEDNNQTGTAQLLGIGSLAEIDGNAEEHFSESDDSDKEDDEIKPDDNLILAGRVEEDTSTLEIYVYNPTEESLYVHHDFTLSAYPLCLEWLDYEPGHSPGNYCAIGSMNSIIEVWDLDIINCLEPAYKLGRKPSRKKGLNRIGHSDAVLSLAWNKNYHHILASGSVDKSILLWDMDLGEPATTINAFTDKVQCLEWKPEEPQTLLAGSCDNTVKLFDCATPENYKTWQTSGEVESLAWNPLESSLFCVGTNTGFIHCYDYRQETPLWTIPEAHEKEVTGLSISDRYPGFLVTSSADGLVKVWDYTTNNQPRMISEKDFGMNLVHCLALCPDWPFVIAAGGDNKMNNFSVYDLQNCDAVRNTFESREVAQATNERME